MEIKRRIEMSIATNRRYIIHQSPTGKKIPCAECGGETLTAEQTAVLFDIKQRRIFQIIEKVKAHFIETEAGAVMICLTSMAAILSEENLKQPMSDAE